MAQNEAIKNSIIAGKSEIKETKQVIKTPIQSAVKKKRRNALSATKATYKQPKVVVCDYLDSIQSKIESVTITPFVPSQKEFLYKDP